MKISVIAFTALFFSLSIISGCTKIKNQTGLPSVETVSTLHDLLKTPVFEMPDGAKFHLGIDGNIPNEHGYIKLYCLQISKTTKKSDIDKSMNYFTVKAGPVLIRERKTGNVDMGYYIQDNMYDKNEIMPLLYSCNIPATEKRLYIYDVYYFNILLTTLTFFGCQPMDGPFCEFQIRDDLLCVVKPKTPRLRKYIPVSYIDRKQNLNTVLVESHKQIKLIINKSTILLSYDKPIFYSHYRNLLIKVSINGKDCGKTPNPIYHCEAEKIDYQKELMKSTDFQINWGKSLYRVNDGDKISVQFAYALSQVESFGVKDGILTSMKEGSPLRFEDTLLIYSNKYTFTYRDEDYKIYKPKREKQEKE